MTSIMDIKDFLALELKPESDYILAVDVNCVDNNALEDLYDAFDSFPIPVPGTVVLLRVNVPPGKTLADYIQQFPKP